MIVYIKELMKAFRMLEEYAKAHEENTELNNIFKEFSNSIGYTASGENRFV